MRPHQKAIRSPLLLPLLSALSSLSLSAYAQVTDPADKYFSSNNPTLSAQEKAALDVSKKWNAGTNIKPFAGPNGVVKFVYGTQQPSVVCAVLQICDIALQAGESVNSVHLGDTARWSVEPAITGSGPTETQHLIIKPMDVGLETSLVVTTTRRIYHIKLRSHRTEYMSQVSFTYPEEALAKWDNVQRRQAEQREQATIPTTGEYLGNLSFDYDVEGSTPWKPVRVFNDGKKTIIEMPRSMEQTEAPTLLVIRKEGGLFSSDETVIVNYRIQRDRYIVDSVFDKAILIAGVGRNQDRITIARRK
jgi:type IV secretion system protein VirB9